MSSWETHQVENQPPPLADYNLWTTDRALREGASREGAGWAEAELRAVGQTYGTAEVLELGAVANRYPPVLRTFDRYGHRRDEVEFHPAWHELMALCVGHGLHTGPWADPRPGAHVVRAAAYLMCAQVEAGTGCPTTMTYGSVPALRRHQEPMAEMLRPWFSRLYSRTYDRRFVPIEQKEGALIGMGMTEKQGGSDVRKNSTRAEPVSGGGPGGEYRLTGHKWFFSAPMCDAFLVLAQAPRGLSCFFLPRYLPDHRPDHRLNALHIQRLKDKVGNRSNASSEVEFHGASAWLLGEEGRGVPVIIEMGTYTRLDCALGTAGMMRQAVAQALHHAAHRMAFGRRLVDQPLMRSVLADLALESEAATALCLRLARAFDRQDDPAETALRRVLTPATKYLICKRGPALAAEAMEVLGGNGYVEEAPLGRIYREMPLNSIWEGSGNIMCLDVLRALHKTPQALEVLRAELHAARGADARLDRHLLALEADLGQPGELELEAQARRLTERLALAVQAALLVRHAPQAVADAFCASRLCGDGGATFGSLQRGADTLAIIERAMPV